MHQKPTVTQLPEAKCSVHVHKNQKVSIERCSVLGRFILAFDIVLSQKQDWEQPSP
jgi:hypothetical protein